MRLISLILLSFAANACANNTEEQHQPSELFLVGGGLKSCSTMSQNQCDFPENDVKISAKESKTSALFQLNKATREQVFELIPTQYSQKHGEKLKKLLNKAIRKASNKPISKRKMVNFLKDFEQ